MPSKAINRPFNDAIADLTETLNHSQVVRYTDMLAKKPEAEIALVRQCNPLGYWELCIGTPLDKTVPIRTVLITKIQHSIEKYGDMRPILITTEAAKGHPARQFILEIPWFSSTIPNLNSFLED